MSPQAAPLPAKNADDPTAWSPHEHHEDPDEIPHDVIGILAVSIVFLALLSAVLWFVAGPVPAIVVGLIAAVWTVVRLTRRAHRERDDEQRMPKDLVERAPPPGNKGEWPPPLPPA